MNIFKNLSILLKKKVIDNINKIISDKLKFSLNSKVSTRKIVIIETIKEVHQFTKSPIFSNIKLNLYTLLYLFNLNKF